MKENQKKKNTKRMFRERERERDILVPTKTINLPKWISMELQREEEEEEKRWW
jgi:hypothetical protein